MEKPQVKVGFGVMILRNSKVLLGLRHSDAKKAGSELHGEGTWTMPGGKMHFGESFEETCFRETKEETGIEFDKNQLKIISISNDMVTDAHFVTIGFLAEKFDGNAKVMEPDEITKWKWFDINSTPTNIFPPSKVVLNNYLSGNIYQSGK